MGSGFFGKENAMKERKLWERKARAWDAVSRKDSVKRERNVRITDKKRST